MSAIPTDYIHPDDAGTLDGLLRERVRRDPDGLAYRHYDRDAGTWIDWRWADVEREVGRWQRALAGEGLRPGERVALLLRNGPEWVVAEQAALSLGLVVVPLYPEDRPDNVAYILNDAAARLLVVPDERYRRFAEVLAGVPTLQRIVVLPRLDGAGADERVCASSDWLPVEAGVLAERQGDPDALATLVYTSGTAGHPKGVMLSHRNILSNAWAASTLERFLPGDRFLSFLPLSHMLERTGGYYLPMLAGCSVVFARSVQQLADDLIQQRPTILIAVPRVFERVYGRIQEQLAKRSRLARGLFRATVAIGWRRFEARQGRRAPGLWQWLWPLLQRRVAAKVTARLGGELRLAVSGGAALNPEIARFFIGLGVELVQGYGLTEASPVVSVNLPADNEPRSVGPALPGVEVAIGEESELLVRGPGVMLGYWNDHRATFDAIDGEGWLHTGDQVRIEAGHIYITGRLKDILVLSNGEKVPPVELEAAITLDPLFDHALIVGEGEPYLAALLVLNSQHWCELAQRLGVDPLAPAALEAGVVQRQVLQRVAAALHAFPGYAKVRRVVLTLEPWGIDNGMLTPTLKLRRREVQQRYAAPLAGLFRQ